MPLVIASLAMSPSLAAIGLQASSTILSARPLALSRPICGSAE